MGGLDGRSEQLHLIVGLGRLLPQRFFDLKSPFDHPFLNVRAHIGNLVDLVGHRYRLEKVRLGRFQQIGDMARLLGLAVEPAAEILGIDDDGHAVMDGAQRFGLIQKACDLFLPSRRHS